MEDLIKALQIFIKYKNSDCPTHCEHDELFVVDITEDEVSEEDKKELERLSFTWADDHWSSFRFGSA